MNLHFTICPLASVILVLVILINIYDIYLIGTSLVFFIVNALLSIVVVWVANKTCFTWHWVSWVIVIYLAISAIGYLTIIFVPEVANEPQMKAIIEKDREQVKTGAIL